MKKLEEAGTAWPRMVKNWPAGRGAGHTGARVVPPLIQQGPGSVGGRRRRP